MAPPGRSARAPPCGPAQAQAGRVVRRPALLAAWRTCMGLLRWWRPPGTPRKGAPPAFAGGAPAWPAGQGREDRRQAQLPGVPRPPVRLIADNSGGPITMPDGPLRVMVHRCEIQPGATLQWLRHPHQRYVYVEQGQLQLEDLAGHRQLYGPGEMLVEQRDVVHRATNCGQRILSLIVFDYVPQAQRANAPL